MILSDKHNVTAGDSGPGFLPELDTDDFTVRGTFYGVLTMECVHCGEIVGGSSLSAVIARAFNHTCKTVAGRRKTAREVANTAAAQVVSEYFFAPAEPECGV